MPHTLVIAMNVTDPDRYDQYRAAMTPILHHFGGSFGYDLVVSHTPKNPAPHPITRLFTMQFPDHQTREAFFADAGYLAVREEYFTKAVDGYSVVAEVDAPDA